MNKNEMDIQLVHYCLTEKWLPMRDGTFYGLNQKSNESCVLCQVYVETDCLECPLKEHFEACDAVEFNNPYHRYALALYLERNPTEEIKAMCDCLENLKEILKTK